MSITEAITHFRLSVTEFHQVDESYSSTPFYELTNAFGGVAWCVRRNKRQDPFFDENMQTLQRILA